MPDYPLQIEVGDSPYRRRLDLQPGQLLLRFKGDATEGDVDGFMINNGLNEHPLSLFPIATDAMRATNLRWIDIDPALSPRDEAHTLMLNHPGMLEEVSPVYIPQGESEIRACAPRPVDVIVKLDVPADIPTIADIEGLGGLTHNPDPLGLLGPYEHFRVASGDPGDGLDLIDQIAHRSGVHAVDFDWLTVFPLELNPAYLAYWNNQWNLPRIGMPAAWDHETGRSNVWIAVIDDGFQLDHPDLSSAFTPPDAHFDAWQWLAYYAPPYDVRARKSPHGTLVSGLLASSLNGRALAGVASGCSILPVRVEPFTSLSVAAGLGWARVMKAAVVNMSFSLNVTHGIVVQAVIDAWQARAVLCAAAGNAPVYDPATQVAFPAVLPQVIAVGASDQDDRRKTELSSDGDPWRSRRGSGLDLVAPGVRCPSTDRTGTAGWNNAGPGRMWDPVQNGNTYVGAELGDEDGNYLLVFWGTSASVAHASGVAALIKSRRPTLDNMAVRAAIEAGCRKIDGGGLYTYAATPGHPAGTWNPDVGYGLLSASDALAAADTPVQAQYPFTETAPHGVVPVCGYLGRGSTDGRWRVYSADLGSYVEIAEDDMVGVDPLLGPLEGHRVWLLAGAAMHHVLVSPS